MANTRAQLTGFIILGVAVLAMFLTVFLLTNASQLKKVEGKAEDVQEHGQQAASVATYVTKCLDDVTRIQLARILRQGGMAKPTEFLDYKSTPVTIGISFFETVSPPEYPKEKTPIERLPLHPYGKVTLPPLCKPGGPNDVTLREFAYPCPAASYGNNSIQEQLGVEITKTLTKCVKESVIEELTGTKIMAEKPAVEVVLGKDDLVVNATYPVSLSGEGGTSTTLLAFQTVLPLRLRRLYEVGEFVARMDRIHLGFSPVKLGSYEEFTTEAYDEHITISKKPADDPESGDIIVIKDSFGSSAKAGLAFQIARANRRPVLDYIHQNENEEFDVRVEEDSPVILDVKGVDPDDEAELHYTMTLENGTMEIAEGKNTLFLPGGTHTIRVTVCDKGSLCDWQDVRILVGVDPEDLDGGTEDEPEEPGRPGTRGRVGSGTTGGPGASQPGYQTPTSSSLPTTDMVYGDAKSILAEIQRQAANDARITWNSAALSAAALTLPFSPTASEANDLFKLTIQHDCVGSVCRSTAFTATTERQCTDLQEDDVERCVMAAPSYITTDLLTCTPVPKMQTFEGLVSGGTRLCNKNAKPSTPARYGDGGPYKCKATCDGKGECVQPVGCSCESGTGYTGDADCDDISPTAFDSQRYVIGTGGQVCNAQCKVVNLNADRAACEFLKGPGSYVGGKCCTGCVVNGECIEPNRIGSTKKWYCTQDARSVECAAPSFCTSLATTAYSSPYVYCSSYTGYTWTDNPNQFMAGLACTAGTRCKLVSGTAGYYACQ